MMKTSKIVFGLFIGTIFCLVAAQPIFCQTETLDIVHYTPPKGWARTPKEGAVVFSDVNKTTNSFCVLTIHSGTATSGTAEKDFANEWGIFVVKPYKAVETPKTETQNADGWTVISANAPIETDGIKSIAFLMVYSGYGKTTSILAILNSDTYIKPLTAF